MKKNEEKNLKDTNICLEEGSDCRRDRFQRLRDDGAVIEHHLRLTTRTTVGSANLSRGKLDDVSLKPDEVKA